MINNDGIKTKPAITRRWKTVFPAMPTCPGYAKPIHFACLQCLCSLDAANRLFVGSLSILASDESTLFPGAAAFCQIRTITQDCRTQCPVYPSGFSVRF